MKRWTARWTMAATAAALLTLPLTSAAQSTQPQPPASTQQTAGSTSAQQPSAEAQDHLRKARATLDDVKTTSLNARARTQVNELKKRLTALERAAGTNSQASTTGQAQRSPSATANRGNANWGTEVAAIDKTLTTLLGSGSEAGTSNPSTAGTTGTAGTTKPQGTSQATAVTLDDDTRTKLTEFRTHITAFATAMAGGTASSPAADPSSASGTGTTATTGSTTGTAGTTGSAGTTGTTGAGTTGTSGTTPPSDPQQQTQPATPQVDQEAARRHLTEARNSLSAMTQLPAASQLQGDARTQIAQLITNFNELITTQAEWRASYAKVEANLTSLIGPDPEANQSATGTAGTTGTTGTTATAGTTGAASGIADLDAGIREKLVELRRHLNQFEKAAGGVSAGGAATAAAGTATSGTTGTTATGTTATGTTSGTATSGTTGSTTSGTTGATGTATSGTTGTTAAGQQTTPAQGQADIAKHIAAIETLLQTTDESGGLTLTKAQVEQLRTHWAALRQLLNERR